MKGYSISLFIGILFSAIGTASLFLMNQALISAIWLSFGNGLILASFRFKQHDEQGTVSLQPVPKARLYSGILLIMLAVVLLFFQMYLDLLEG